MRKKSESVCSVVALNLYSKKNKECAYILIEFKQLLITEFKAVPTSVVSAMRESKVKHMVCALS